MWREVSATAERGILRADILVKTNRPEAAEHNAMQAAASACEQPMRAGVRATAAGRQGETLAAML